MKKSAAVLSAFLAVPTLVTAAAAPAVATAAPRDPVAAVRQQIAKKGGVRFSENVRATFMRRTLAGFRRSGVLRFGPRGVAAYDVKTTSKDPKIGSSRLVGVGRHSYVQGSGIDDLPEGKKWVRLGFVNPGGGTFLDITNPKVLKTILASTKSRVPGGSRTTVYRGVTTLQRLAKVSEDARVLVKTLKSKKPVPLRWGLWVGANRLPQRFTSSLVILSTRELGDALLTSDVRLTGWGTRLTVKAPPAAQVIDLKDLNDEDLEKEITGRFLVPFGDPANGLEPAG